jgi:hypothetical protein
MIKNVVFIPVVLTLAAILTPGCGQQEPTMEGSTAGRPPVWEWAAAGAGESPAADAASFRVDTERMSTHAWWNQPSMVEALELDPAQRAEMDGVLNAYLSKWSTMGAKRRQARERMNEAVINRDTEEARRIADELAWAAAYFQGSPPRLKVEVFALLGDDQMRRVVEEQPFLLNSKWIHSTSMKSK